MTKRTLIDILLYGKSRFSPLRSPGRLLERYRAADAPVQSRSAKVCLLAAAAAACLLGSATAGRTQSAAFVALDSSTKGNWPAHYGNDGYVVVGATAVNASYSGAISAPNASTYVWNQTNYDVKALYKSPALTDRIAATWYNTGNAAGGSFTIDVPITDTTVTHQVALFCSDYDNGNRAETVKVQTPSGTVLDTESVSGFSDGKYLVWNVKGHVQFVVTQTAGTSAVVSGVFLDPPPAVPTALGEIDVTQYGTVSDGITDNTAAFQRALNAAGRTGALVKVPAGQYSFGSSTNANPQLFVPNNVVLEGVNAGERTYLGYSSGTASGDVTANRGTVFLVQSGTVSGGNTGATPFITLNGDSALRDVALYYPNQPLSTSANWKGPVPYPVTIFMNGTNSSVDYVCGINPYAFITKSNAVRTNVRHVSGQPLYHGLTVDATLDVTKYEDIHFSQSWDNHAAMTNWMLANAWAFLIYRGDDMKFTDCSAVGYSRGFYLGVSTMGNSASEFEDCTAENCLYGAWIDSAPNDAETTFHGCAFSSVLTQKGAAVLLSPSNNGNVAFDGCRFWQAQNGLFLNQSAASPDPNRMTGVVIVGCSFDDWGTGSTGLDPASAAIICGNPGSPSAASGKTSITDCTFNLDQYTYTYTGGVQGVLFEGNTTVSGTHVQAVNALLPGPGGYYKIQPASNTTLAMDDENFGTANGNGIQIYQDTGATAQRWMLILNTDGSYGISPACALGSGLDDYGGSTMPGTSADLWQLMPGDPHTEWNLLPTASTDSAPTLTVADGNYNINQYGASLLMLDVPGGNFASGTALDLYTQNGTAAQNWLLTYQLGYIQINNS